MKKILLTACLSAALCAPAMADDSGFRMGVGYTFTKAKGNNFDSGFGDGIKWDLGYDINRFISITASYEANSGDTDYVRIPAVPPTVDTGGQIIDPGSKAVYYQADGKTLKTGAEFGYGFQFDNVIQSGYVRPYVSAGYLYYEEGARAGFAEYDTSTFYYGLGIHFQANSGAYINVSYDFATLDSYNFTLNGVNNAELDLGQGSVVFGYRF